MSVSISWLLRQQHLGLIQRAGPQVSGHEIEFAQTTELVDPTPWLSGGELILTTGLDYRGDGTSYVERLRSADIAALGFGTGLSHDTVPDDLVDAAEKLGITLLEVPYTTPFAAVTRAVMARLAEQEYEKVLEAANVQTKITRAALRGGLPAIVRELSIAIGKSVAFVGVRSSSVYPLGEQRLVTEARAVIAANSNTGGAASISSSTPDRTLTLQPVGLGRPEHGHLAVASPGALGNIDRILLGHAVSLMTLDLEKPVRLRMEQVRLNEIAVGLLLDGRFTDRTIPAYLGDAADSHDEVRVLSVKVEPTPELLRQMDNVLHGLGRMLFARSFEQEVVTLLRGNDSPDLVVDLLAHLPVSTARRIRSGISRPHPISESALALRQARVAANLAGAGPRALEYSAGTGAELITSPEARETLSRIAKSIDSVLAVHDEEHGSNLVASLRAFLEANGQWESAAAYLNVHRHTLRGRIVRVEKLLGCDMSQASVRAELLLALLVGDVDGT